MAERALRIGSPSPVASSRRREGGGERVRFDRAGGGRGEWGLAPPSRGEPAGDCVPWPVLSGRRLGALPPSVAPPPVEPAAVALPRAAAAGPPCDAPPVAPVDPVRDGVPSRRCPIDRSLRGVMIATALHLAGVAGLLAMPHSEPPGGGVAIETVELVMFEAEASVDQVAGGQVAGGAAAPTAVATPEPDPEPAEAEPPSPPQPEVVATEPPPPSVTEPEPPIPAVVDEPPLPILVTTRTAEEAVAPPPPVASPPPVAAPSPEVRPVEPARKPAKPAAAKPAKPVKPVEPAKPAAATATAPGDAAQTRTSGARSAGAATGAAGSGALADWRSAVLAALARAKRYPVDAHDRGVVGRAVISFTVTREGTVTAVSLVTSSGAAVLDAATLAMPRRAAFPTMSAGGPATQTFTTGVRYDLH